jgi:hypothetical protein
MRSIQQKRRSVKRALAVAVVAGLAVFAIAEEQMVKHTVAIKKGKSSLAPIATTVLADTTLTILDRQGSFVHVRAPDGTVGFVMNDDFPPKPSKFKPGDAPVDPKYAGAGRGLEDEALSYAGTKQTKLEAVKALSDLKELGDQVSDDALQTFANEQHLGPMEYRQK